MEQPLEAAPLRSIDLNGTWRIAIDPDNTGKSNEWHRNYPLDESRDVPVPGVVQLAFPDFFGVSWYRTTFRLEGMERNLNYYLRFESIHYFAQIYLNGVHIGDHEGEMIPFELSVTQTLKWDGDNELVVRVINPVADRDIDGFNLNRMPKAFHNETNTMSFISRRERASLIS